MRIVDGIFLWLFIMKNVFWRRDVKQISENLDKSKKFVLSNNHNNSYLIVSLYLIKPLFVVQEWVNIERD